MRNLAAGVRARRAAVADRRGRVQLEGDISAVRRVTNPLQG